MNARKRLGLLKWNVVEVWPAARRERKAARLRPSCLGRALELPRVSMKGPPLDLEVHMLCGEKTADMGIWASWSMMRFMPGALLYIHSDGTLEQHTVALWRNVLPQLRLIPRGAAADHVKIQLRAYPHLLRWHTKHLAAIQNVDYHLCGARRYVLGMDTDVLCFAPPRAILEAIRGGRQTPLWMRDCMYAYSMPQAEWLRRYGPAAPILVNGGFYLAPRFSVAHWACMDHELSHWSEGVKDAYWSQQTLLAALFSKTGGRAFDSSTYGLRPGPHSSDLVVRHYPGPKFFRPRFFTEGIGAVARTSWGVAA